MEIAERVRRGRQAIVLARHQGLDTTDWEQHLEAILDNAGREPTLEAGLEPWMLWEWRRVSIPKWRCILHESIDQGDGRREEYARWMLEEILLDPEYRVDQNYLASGPQNRE